jgi:hypothetical protein
VFHDDKQHDVTAIFSLPCRFGIERLHLEQDIGVE